MQTGVGRSLWIRIALSPFLVCTTLAIGAQSAAYGSGCDIVTKASLPVVWQNNYPFITAAINGAPVTLLLDTGAQASILTPGAVSRMNLPFDDRYRSVIFGIGASKTPARVASVSELTVGDIAFRNFGIPVNATPITVGSGIDGVLGEDVLSRYDLEFDFPGSRFNMHTVTNCTGDFVPWTQTHYSIPFQVSDPGSRILIQAQVDHRPLQVNFDTGFFDIVIGKSDAIQLGFDARQLVLPAMKEKSGLANEYSQVWRYTINEIMIGPETLSDVPVEVVDAAIIDGPVVVGESFMKSRKIWVSHGTKQIFIAPTRTGFVEPMN